MSEVITFEMCNGLRESTEEDLQIAKECFDAQIPLSAYWARTDNDAKYITWDSEWEKYCKHRAELIDFEGRDKFLPWKLHEENRGSWDSWGYLQRTGDCISGDTKILLLEGATTISDCVGRVVDLVSYDTINNTPCIRHGRAYKTSRKQMIEISVSPNERYASGVRKSKRTLKDGTVVESVVKRNSRKKVVYTFELSVDHKVMLKSGDMIRAGELQPGMRVVSGHTSVGKDGYATFYHKVSADKILPYRIHGLLAPAGKLVHHKNHIKTDNRRENLEILDKKVHAKLHSANSETSLSNVAIKKKTQDSFRKRKKAELLQLFWHLTTAAKSDKEELVYGVYRQQNSVAHKYPSRIVSAESVGRVKLYALKKRIRHYFGSYEKWSTEASLQNGTITSVRLLGEKDCYDIEVFVDEPDDSRKFTNHNFYLCDKFADGYKTHVMCVKNCCSFGHLSSLHASQLTICKTTGRTPIGINPSYTYAFARGNGKMSFGSGLNLSPMMKYAAKIGNYRIQDVGKYDCSVRNYNSQYDAGALQNQTIAVILPKVDFDLIFLACSAGFGVHTGASRYPSSSSVNSDGLAVASGFSSGGHATAYVAAYTSKSGKRYIYFMNSHGAKYAADELSGGQKQHGCWVDNQLYRSHAITSSYGAPYVNLPEIPK